MLRMKLQSIEVYVNKGGSMLIIETLNSTYKIEALGDMFKVTKLEGGPKKYYLDKGESKLHKMIALQVGYRGHFDSIQTTTIKSIKEG
jgi:hypothetical protein